MEIKSDSIIFNELLKIVDTYNEVYKDGINSYLTLNLSNTAKPETKTKSKSKTKRRTYDDDYDLDYDYEDEGPPVYRLKDDSKNKLTTDNFDSTKPSDNKIDEKYFNSEKKKCDLEKTELINSISNSILDTQYPDGLDYIKCIKGKIANFLIAQVLDNSPEADVTVIKFPNIKTQLYPYQINNLNWMLNIEKHNYPEQFKEQTEKLLFKGGGLFDEVGMGKTLQIITLINTNLSKKESLVYNNKIYTKATLIIVPNHLCGQWAREFTIHLVNPLKTINLLTKAHYKKYTYFDFVNADIVIVSANFFVNCKLNQHEQIDPLFNILNIFDKDVNIFSIYWHRVVIDEYHEIEDSQLFIKLKFLESDHRWIISGTPFKEKSIEQYVELDSTSLSSVVDYLTY